MPPLISAFLTLIGGLILAIGLGRRLLLVTRCFSSDRLDNVVLGSLIGLGALQFLPFTLFATRLGAPRNVRAALIAVFLLSLPDCVAAIRSVARRPAIRLSTGGIAFAVLLAFVGICLWIRAVCPDWAGDPIDYHITSAARYLQAGRFVYLPTFTYTNWPLGVQMLFSLPLALNPTGSVAVVCFLLGLLGTSLTALFAYRVASTRAVAPTLCALMLFDGFSQHGYWFQMVHAYIDIGLTAFATAALYCLFRAGKSADASETARLRRLAALFAGLTATCKMTGVWMILAGATAVLLVEAHHPKLAMRRALAFLLSGIAVVLPWFAKTWAMTGNPVYPMLFGILGGREWTGEGMARFLRAHYIWNTPPGMRPTPFVLNSVHGLYAVTGIGIAFWLIRAARRSPHRMVSIAWAVFLAAVLTSNYMHPRFLMPLVPTFAVLLVARRLKNRWLVAVITAGGVTAAVIGSLAMQPRIPEALEFDTGQIAYEALLRRNVEAYPVIQYVNANVSPNETILLGGYDSDPLFYRPMAITPVLGIQDSIHFDSQRRLVADLHRLRIRYLVLNAAYPPWCDRSWACSERLHSERDGLVELVKRHGTLLFSSGDNAVYRLDLPQAEAQ